MYMCEPLGRPGAVDLSHFTSPYFVRHEWGMRFCFIVYKVPRVLLLVINNV